MEQETLDYSVISDFINKCIALYLRNIYYDY